MNMEHYDVFGMKVSNYTIKDLEQLFDRTIHSGDNIVIYGYSFGLVSFFKKYPDLYPIANSYDVLVCDGTLFNWYCNLFRFKLKTVMSVPEITNFTLEYANKNNLKVLLFGAPKEVNIKANQILTKRFPNITFPEGIDGYFRECDEDKIIERINEISPDILLIGISGPIKERFAYKYKKVINSSIIIPCGGMIDVYAGKTKQSPRVIKKMGLASPYRIIQEPRRLLFLNLWMTYETIFKIIPITILYRFILGKEFNLIEKYLKIKQ
jgi:N-acetylglucosaminyldiphosphoundecaprenol N-acetyl-beta-D-mannosaminyltransferase